MSQTKDSNNSEQQKTSSYEKMTQNLDADGHKKPQPSSSELPKNTDATGDNKVEHQEESNNSGWQEKKIADLENRNKTLQKSLDEEKIRTFAELENMRKRQEKDLNNARSYAIKPFVESLLSIGDALEMGITSAKDPQTKEGLVMIWDSFCQTLKKHDVEIIKDHHVPFDHNFHEAIVMQPSDDVEPNHIIQVVQSGYKLKDRLIRPARVIVSQKK